MLQQTVVAAVAPRFEAWLRRFPDLATLAAAEPSEVLRAWEGLGYYSRARNLHATARRLVEQGDATLPDSYQALRKLPGIGDYTACAILSLAYGRPFPVVDANVKRVTQRLLALPEWTPDAERQVRSFLDARIGTRQPGAFNEAMMELGALVCTPRSPDCAHCPLAAACRARRLGIVALIPERRRQVVKAVESVVVIAICGERVWVVPASRAPETIASPKRDERKNARSADTAPAGFLGGLLAFPRLDAVAPFVAKLAATSAPRSAPHAKSSDGGPHQLRAVLHSYLDVRERLLPVLVRLPRCLSVSVPSSPPGRWVSLSALETLAMPSAYRRIAHALPGARIPGALDTRHPRP